MLFVSEISKKTKILIEKLFDFKYIYSMNFDLLKNQTECGKKLESLELFYSALDNDLNDFNRKTGICCKCDHGSCCENYVPELTSTESEYLAYVIIKEGKDEEILEKLSNYDRSSGVCPIYRKEGEFHCSLYLGRGLICRLFGSACFIGKDGRACFRRCKWNKEKSNSETIYFDEEVPTMGSYGRMLAGLDGNYDEKESIEIALPKAINKIRFLLMLAEADK